MISSALFGLAAAAAPIQRYQKAQVVVGTSVLAMAVVAGWFEGAIALVAAAAIGLLCVLCGYLARASGAVTILHWMGVFVLAFALGSHWVPGFSNPLLAARQTVSDAAPSFALYAGFDKAAAGIALIVFLSRRPDRDNLRAAYFYALLASLVVIAAMTLLAFTTDFVRFDPKLPEVSLLFVFVNVVFVCYPETAFFQLLVQNFSKRAILALRGGRYAEIGPLVAICVAAIVFTLAHRPSDLKYGLLTLVLGFAVAYVYEKTGRFGAAVVVHSSVNLAHFFFFTYPRLSPQ